MVREGTGRDTLDTLSGSRLKDTGGAIGRDFELHPVCRETSDEVPNILIGNRPWSRPQCVVLGAVTGASIRAAGRLGTRLPMPMRS
jgi:hypothetical protein